MNRKQMGIFAIALAAGAAAAKADSFGPQSLLFVPAVTITVTPSSAPNAFGSPSFAQYQTNAITALENGQSSYGDPTQPTYYQAITSPISVASNIVTSFPSWQGSADVSGAFASELGNRVTFGFHAVAAPNTTFSISQLSFDATSTDPSNSLGFGFNGGYNYSAGYVGLNYGTDGIKGTGDDVYITSGADTQQVNELFGRGSGNAWAALSGDPGSTNQDKINNAANAVWAGAGSAPFDFTGTYSILAAPGSTTVLASGSATVTFNAVGTPLPKGAWAGLALFGVIGAGVVSSRKRHASIA